MVVINPKLVSDSLDYRQGLSNKEKTALKKNFGRLWEVMAGGNLIPPKSFQARTVNFEYLPNDIVVEVPAVINKKGANGKKLDNYPKTFGALLNSQTGVIQLTTEAILNKSKHGAYLALLSDPIVDDAIKAEKLLNTMIIKQSKFLGYLN